MFTPKFYDTYQIQHIGEMACKLAFPTQSKIHLVFQVLCLKKVVGQKCHVQMTLPELDEEGSIWIHLEAILDKRECHLFQQAIDEVLIQWKDIALEDATWEPSKILQQFLSLNN
jgi:tRNA U34 5-carboxymethylaminomethyl modifying enzyme MnmG/GidA